MNFPRASVFLTLIIRVKNRKNCFFSIFNIFDFFKLEVYNIYLKKISRCFLNFSLFFSLKYIFFESNIRKIIYIENFEKNISHEEL